MGAASSSSASVAAAGGARTGVPRRGRPCAGEDRRAVALEDGDLRTGDGIEPIEQERGIVAKPRQRPAPIDDDGDLGGDTRRSRRGNRAIGIRRASSSIVRSTSIGPTGARARSACWRSRATSSPRTAARGPQPRPRRAAAGRCGQLDRVDLHVGERHKVDRLRLLGNGWCNGRYDGAAGPARIGRDRR